MPAAAAPGNAPIAGTGASVDVTIGTAPPAVPPPPPPEAPPPPPEPPPPPPGAYYWPPPPQNPWRWSGALRLTYGIPGGNVFRGQPLSDFAQGLFHIEGATDLVIFERVVLGAHLGGGIAAAGDGFQASCAADGANCGAWNFDIGLHAEYRFLPPPFSVNPWIGIGVSYEVLGLSESDVLGNDISGTFGGTDLDLSAGCDFQAGPFALGPFATLRVGRYTSTSLSENGVNIDAGEIGRTSTHDWLMLGVRGRY